MVNTVVSLIVGFVLTLFIYSYLLGDNPLYRVGVHILVGSSAAYAAIVVIRQVLWPIYTTLQDNPGDIDGLLWLVPIFFGLLLLFQRLPSIAWLSNNTLAMLVGIGASVALVGAFTGTLWPQLRLPVADTQLFTGQNLLVALLTAVTLLSFQFTRRQKAGTATWEMSSWRQNIFLAGRIILTITFGFVFASILNSSFALLAERVGFFVNQLLQLIL